VATLAVSLKEVVDFLLYNNYVPENILHVIARRDGVAFTICPKKRFLSSIPAKITFIKYEHNYAHVQMFMRTFRGKIVDSVINKMIQTSKLPEHVKIKYPDIFVYVNEAMMKKIKGVTVENMEVHNGILIVTLRSAAEGRDTAAPQG